jgi:hypothetical protein
MTRRGVERRHLRLDVVVVDQEDAPAGDHDVRDGVPDPNLPTGPERRPERAVREGVRVGGVDAIRHGLVSRLGRNGVDARQ